MDGDRGAVTVEPPLSKAWDFTVFEACVDLIIGMTSRSALQSDHNAFKPIHYGII